MGILDFIKAGIGASTIGRPDNKRALVAWRWPDAHISEGAELVVDVDECAVFSRGGRSVGLLPGGIRHSLTRQSVPLVSELISDPLTDPVVVEVTFVKTGAWRIAVGGESIELNDPITGDTLLPRLLGEFSAQIVDPSVFVSGYPLKRGGVAPHEFVEQLKRRFASGVKTALEELSAEQGRSLRDLPSLKPLLWQRLAQRCLPLGDIGVAVLQFAHVDIHLPKLAEERPRAAGYCGGCGAPASAGARFCSECGTAMVKT
jgi:membrane protease subunit (stomatin/prohibitin family)